MQFLLGVSHESVAETINFANWFTGTMCLELWVSVKRRGRGGDGVTKLHQLAHNRIFFSKSRN
jgi:hypothetical protein